MALPRPLQHGARTAHHACGNSAASPSPAPAARRVARPESGVPGVRGPPLAGLAGRVDAAGQDLSSVLPPPQARVRRLASPALRAATAITRSPTSNMAMARRWRDHRMCLTTTASSSCRRLAAWPCAGRARWRESPKTVTISREADGWYAVISCADVPAQPLPRTGRETGIDVGLKVFLITADGDVVENPRHYRRGEKRADRRRSVASPVARRGATAAGRRWATFSGRIRRCSGNAPTFITRRRSGCSETTTRSLWKICRSPTWCGTAISPSPSRMRVGRSSVPSSKPKQHALGVEWSLCHLPTPARTVAAVGSVCPRSLSVRTHVCTSCGLILDRDENAARNIQWAGQALRGLAG